MRSWKIPTADQIQKVVALIPQAEQYRYFFDQLKNPRWIQPLKEKGFFSNPPPVTQDERRGTVGFSPWPESRYLTRMAAEAANDVLSVILEIKPTENVRVHEDFADAALALPVELSAKLVKHAKEWLKNPYLLLLPQKLGKLVNHLAEGGQKQAAFALAQALLEVLPDPNPPAPDEAWRHPEPKPRLKRDWDYQEIVKQILQPLMKADAEEALNLFSSTLADVLRMTQRPGVAESFEDASTVWFEDVGRNDIGFKDVLVSAVRDIALSIGATGSSNLERVVQKLEDRRWTIFRRTALYLLRTIPEAPPQLIGDRLANQELFNEQWREYKLLARDRFGAIREDQQKLILKWIDEGPGDDYLAIFAVEQRDKVDKFWKVERLDLIKEFLSHERRKALESLIAETQPPEPPDAPMMTSWTGPTSPKSPDELREMMPAKILEFLRTWKPPQRDMDHSRIGLERAFAPVVAEKPEAFTAVLPQAQGLDPTYLRGFVQGFESAVKAKKSFDWKPVLNLCEWVMAQAREIPGRVVAKGFLNDDPDWGWTRKAIANLLDAGCREQVTGIPFELRDTVATLLARLVEERDPTPEDESGEGKMEPFNASVNWARPVAMHALIHYGLWVRRSLERKGRTKEDLRSKGFAEMPEMQRILEDHLNPKKDPSPAVRSVYGQWFPWISYLDPAWAKANVAQIFNQTGPDDKLSNVAWNTYLRANQPYDEVYGLLSSRYRQAISELDAITRDKLTDQEEQLAQHLMTLAWRGKIAMDVEDGIWSLFWKKSSPALRGKAVEFIGRSFYQTKGEAPELFKERARAIWEQRLNYAREHAEEARASNELSGFGWWFASTQFVPAWSLPQLIEALNFCTKPASDYFIMQRLAPIAIDWPLESIQVLTGLINLDREGWGMAGWSNESRQVIQAARDSENARARELAIELINRLGTLGHLEFRDLLPKSGSK